MITGRDVVVAVVAEEGTKRRNQRLHVGSTTTSDEEMSLMDLELGLGGIFQSMKLRRRRLMVPLERPVISLMAERMEVEKRTFHGRRGLVSKAMVAMTLIEVEKCSGEKERICVFVLC